ncbi:putative FBD-associated F-box protein At5g56390 [Cornus florida]|uniref:putative FBD-associated F-box protein At5g56390 n=1 Tax=Cornus florida TaxID=4283 RepID=UPI0028A0D6A4|nr:putative FBD-associated F-box protein At5g56390 [Cornus florida]
MKEAARTSLLSKRWSYMWTHIATLNFDATHILNELKVEDKELEVERHLYLSWVNIVLKSHNGPTIDEFRVQFDLDETCKFDIDNWVNFAVEKRVRRLELDLLDIWLISREEEDYNFPDGNRITNHLHSLSLGFTGFNSLTNLFLKYVNVTGQVLEHFLTNCPFLEQLCVEKSDCLINLKVPDLSLKLQRLEITYCFNVESIEISAMNLVSFMYFGPKISLPFKNVQDPVELYFGGDYCNYLICNFWEISSYLSQLESLTLYMTIVELEWPGYNQGRNRESHSCVTFRPHQYLKVVEVIGFVGCTNDVELARYLIKSAVMLEKITFDPRNPLHMECSLWEIMETEESNAARKCAEDFRSELPVGAALVIL